MADLDELLTADISRTAAETAEPPDFAVIERRGGQRRRRHAILVVSAAAVVVTIIAVGASVVSGTESTAPSPIHEPTPSPTRPEPTSSPTRSEPAPRWAGGLRTDQASLPVLSLSEGRLDRPDAAVAGVDIRRIMATRRPEWRLELRAAPPLASTLDPVRRIMEHGVVVDADGDRLADCHIAISTDAPTPGDLRVRVTNLRTGVTSEQVGPPYGYPIDFFHPAEGEEGGLDPATARTVVFFFLGGEAPACDRFGRSAMFYTYAVVLDRGRPAAFDFAPDAAWLEMP